MDRLTRFFDPQQFLGLHENSRHAFDASLCFGEGGAEAGYLDASGL
jgi:hypothetical protein